MGIGKMYRTSPGKGSKKVDSSGYDDWLDLKTKSVWDTSKFSMTHKNFRSSEDKL